MPQEKIDRLFELMAAFAKAGTPAVNDFDAAIAEGIQDFLKEFGYPENKTTKKNLHEKHAED